MSALKLSQKLNLVVRAVSFEGDKNKPFYLGHADQAELADDALRKRYQEYISENDGMPPNDVDDFEEFLMWLEESYEYFQIIIVEGIFHF